MQLPYTFTTKDSNNRTDEQNDPLHLEEWVEEEDIPDFDHDYEDFEDSLWI